MESLSVAQAGFKQLSASASQVAGSTDMYQHTWLIFVFLVKTRIDHVGQAGLKLLTSSDPPASTSQSAGNEPLCLVHSSFLMYSWNKHTLIMIEFPHSLTDPWMWGHNREGKIPDKNRRNFPFIS